MQKNKRRLLSWLSASFSSSILLFALSTFPAVSQEQRKPPLERMNIASLNSILEATTNNVTRINQRQWQLELKGNSIIVVADEASNRMRIIAPVTQASELSSEEVLKMMLANYHTSLDSRYAINQEGIVVAVFLHPLSSLQENDLQSALRQVTQLVTTFGTDYSSGELYFDDDASQRRNSSPNENEIGI